MTSPRTEADYWIKTLAKCWKDGMSHITMKPIFIQLAKKSLRPPEAMSAQIRGQGILSQYNQIKPFSLEKPIHSTLFLVAAS